MNSPGPFVHLAVALVVTAGCIALPACGGTTTTTSTAPVAKFTPDNPNPGNATIALLAGSVNGASVSLRVAVTGVTGFFGTAFRVTYDPDALLFNGYDASSSFLLQAVNASDVLFLADSNTIGGTIVATATRLDPSRVPAIDVTTTATLMTLNFIARKPISVGAAEGRLDFGDPKQVCDGTVVAPGCGAITVTWSGGGVSAQ